MREAPGPEPEATFARFMYGNEHNIVVGKRASALSRRDDIFPAYVRHRTDRLATDGDSRYYDARRQNLGAVRGDPRPQ